jgi:SAM-dependent methyltransferase
MEAIHQGTFNFVLDRLNAISINKRRLLDVGCAYGFFVKAAKKAGWEAEGLEVSEFAADYGRKKYHLDIYTGTLESYASSKGQTQFGAITMLDVLEHLPDQIETIKTISSLLAPGGIVVAKVPNVTSLRATLARSRWRQFKPPEHLHYFTPRSIALLFRSAGITVRYISKTGGLGLNLKGGSGGNAVSKGRLYSALKRVVLPVGRVAGLLDLLLVFGQKRAGMHG